MSGVSLGDGETANSQLENSVGVEALVLIVFNQYLRTLDPEA